MSKKYSTKDWRIVSFHVSDKPNKKYFVILRNKNDTSAKPVRMYFGAKKRDLDGWIPYEQFRDSTPLGHYRTYDHNDNARLDRYLNRHKPFDFDYITPNLLSLLFLWN